MQSGLIQETLANLFCGQSTRPTGIGLYYWHRSQLEGSMILPRQNSVRDRSSTARTSGCSLRGYEHDLIGRPDNLI